MVCTRPQRPEAQPCSLSPHNLLGQSLPSHPQCNLFTFSQPSLWSTSRLPRPPCSSPSLTSPFFSSSSPQLSLPELAETWSPRRKSSCYRDPARSSSRPVRGECSCPSPTSLLGWARPPPRRGSALGPAPGNQGRSSVPKGPQPGHRSLSVHSSLPPFHFLSLLHTQPLPQNRT